MTRLHIITILTALCAAATGLADPALAGGKAENTDGRFLLAQLTRSLEGDQVCCVRAGRRSRTSKEACRRALGTVRPVSE